MECKELVDTKGSELADQRSLGQSVITGGGCWVDDRKMFNLPHDQHTQEKITSVLEPMSGW